jgi:hypothetical protein
MFLAREDCKEHTVPDISNLVIKIDPNGVVQTSGNFGKFLEASEKAKKSATTLKKSMGGLGNNFATFSLITNKLPGPLKSVASGLTGMVSPATAAIGTVIELTEAAVNFAKGSIQAFSDFEMIKTNLEIVTGSAQGASTTFNQLRDMAGKTPSSVEGLANAAVQLRQTGTSAKELIPTLTLLGNVVGDHLKSLIEALPILRRFKASGKQPLWICASLP